jgi:electron transfer flavoprotein beta subunit
MLARSSVGLFRASGVQHGMTICVGVKRVVDYTVKIRVKDNKVVTDNVKMSVNPFDEIAIEEAVRIKEKGKDVTVIAITVGPKKNEESLRSALALGADKAVHIVTAEGQDVEPLAVAKIFQKLHEEMKPELWLLGKQAIDGDYGMTAQMLAGLLDVSQGTYAAEVKLSEDGKKVKVTREVDTGSQVVELTTPAVLTADLRLNTPRHAALQKIMQARKKPIDSRKIEDLKVDIAPRLTSKSVSEPSLRKAGVMVKSVDELIDKLKNEAKVL